MLPRNFSSKWVVVLGVLIIAVAGSSLLLSKFSSNNPNNLSNNSSSTRVFPTEAASRLINPKYKIISQDQKDSGGRTVFYSVDRFNYKTYPNWGIGEVFDPTSKEKRLSRVIGSLSGWEAIPNTKDQYLILEDPSSHQAYTKTRVAFESNPVLDGRDNATELDVENLSTGKVEQTKKLFIDLNQQLIAKLMKKGDAIVVYTMFNVDDKFNNLPLLDTNGYPYARMIIIRRNEGLKQIEEENGKIF